MDHNNQNLSVSDVFTAGSERPNSRLDNRSGSPAFYTVAETARLLRVNAMTIYRAIREDSFPAIRLRSRYVIPAAAVEKLAAQATESGGCVDVAAIAAERRTAREVARLSGRGGRP